MLPGCVPWPEQLVERYRREGYWRGETLGELTRHWSRIDERRIAIVAGDRSWTYGEIDTRADRLAAGLRRLGVRPHDRVVIQLPNVPEFVVVCVALFRLGAVPVLALPAHRRHEIEYLCRFTEAVAYVVPDVYQGFDYRALAREVRHSVTAVRHVIVIGDAEDFIALDRVDALPEELPPVAAGDVAFFLLSGGTSGVPKLIPRTHDDYAYQLRATAEALRFDEQGVYLAALPIAHNAALGCPGVLGALLAGGKAVLAPSPSPGEVFPLIERERVTLTTLISPLVALWVRTAPMFRATFPHLLLQVGGAKLDPALGRQVRPVLGCRLSHWFGMAEGLLCHTRLDDPDEVVVLTQGRPLSPADDLRVVDDRDADVPQGEVGELLARGPYTLRGYYNADAYNATAFTADGYLRTGDLVRITSAGHLVVEGRIKDVINRGGEKISAEEVEQHLLQHPSVREVAVVPMPDPLLGERVCAFVVPRGTEPTASAVRQFLADRGLAHYKLPDRIELTGSLPRTNLGKINKAALRDRVVEEARAASRALAT